MSDSNYEIKTMTRTQLDAAVDWAAAEGWNPGLHDADCFYAADSDGFLVGLLDGEPVACISAVKYPGNFGFLGFYIVTPEHRSHGLGLKIWNAAISRLESCVVGLDGVVDQQANYRKSGFTLAHNNYRYEGVGSGTADSDDAIIPLADVPFREVEAYDRPLFPSERIAFLKCWINQPEHVALGIVNGGRLAGYGVLRPCRAGYKVGPLFADSADLADRLFSSLQSHAAKDSPVFLDIPGTNPAAAELVKRHGMTVQFETARMYKGEHPTFPIEKMFGITTFELG